MKEFDMGWVQVDFETRVLLYLSSYSIFLSLFLLIIYSKVHKTTHLLTKQNLKF